MYSFPFNLRNSAAVQRESGPSIYSLKSTTTPRMMFMYWYHRKTSHKLNGWRLLEFLNSAVRIQPVCSIVSYLQCWNAFHSASQLSAYLSQSGLVNALPQSIPKSYSSALYKQRVEMLMVSLLQDQLLLHFVQGWIICFFKEWGDQSLKEFTPNNFYSPSCGSKPVGVSFLCWTQNKIFWRTKQLLVTTDSRERNTMEVNGVIASIFQNRNSYRFGKTWGWVNDDNIFILGWAIPLNTSV